MRLKVLLSSVVLLGFVAAATPGFSDELVEAARREKARREALKKKRDKQGQQASEPAPVLSNDSLKQAGSEGNMSQVTGQAAPAGTAAKPATPAAAKAGDESAIWRERIGDASAAVERAKQNVADLKEQLNEATRQASSVDDPNLRVTAGSDRLRLETEVTKAELAVKDAEKAVADMREQARRAGVAPGDLR